MNPCPMRSLIVVAFSAASNYPRGGAAWVHLSWVLGLRRLGHDVLLVDQLDRARCQSPRGTEPTYGNCLNRPYFEAIIRRFGLQNSAVLIGEGGESLYGPSYAELLERAEAADLLVNLSGNLRLEEVKRRFRLKVYVDLDPGLTHHWLASGRIAPRIAGHDLHFTVGENVGTTACPLPTCGITWRHTRPPVLLDEWPVAPGGEHSRFTTVGVWRGVGPHGHLDEVGIRFGQKADELTKVLELPRLVSQTFELALLMTSESDHRDRALLERYSWRVVDPTVVACDPDSIRRYVRNSGGEFSVAKGVYVQTSSGWFSDRTTCYLASGKPALVQDTGFGRNIPVGEGLLAFRSLDDAVAGAKSIAADYAKHSRAARWIAEEHFDSDKVLTRFLNDVETARRS